MLLPGGRLRQEHLELFEHRLSGKGPHVVALRGGMGKKQRQAAVATLAAIPPNEGRVILATGKYIGEGFDDSRLDTLFLTLPVSWRGTAAQYVGRLHRLYDGKREVHVYDYADIFRPTPKAPVEPEAHPRPFCTGDWKRCRTRVDDST
jgi:superfamily II DNA or RNA helicase